MLLFLHVDAEIPEETIKSLTWSVRMSWSRSTIAGIHMRLDQQISVAHEPKSTGLYAMKIASPRVSNGGVI